MSTLYPKEVAAIESLRKAFPNQKQMTLAKMIANEGTVAFDSEYHPLVSEAHCRTVYSTYSVIRRFDAKQKRDAKLAAKVTKALAAVGI